MKKIILKHGHPFQFNFHPERLQVAYYKDYWMKPEDHGYYPNMKAYHDYEDDECISRHFDNASSKLVTDGFLTIVEDEFKEHHNFSAEHHITLSEVNRMLKECKPTKKKLKAKINHTKKETGKEAHPILIKYAQEMYDLIRMMNTRTPDYDFGNMINKIEREKKGL